MKTNNLFTHLFTREGEGTTQMINCFVDINEDLDRATELAYALILKHLDNDDWYSVEADFNAAIDQELSDSDGGLLFESFQIHKALGDEEQTKAAIWMELRAAAKERRGEYLNNLIEEGVA